MVTLTKHFLSLCLLILALTTLAASQETDPIHIDVESEVECLKECTDGDHQCVFQCIVSQCQSDCEEQEPDSDKCFDHCVEHNIDFPEDFPAFETCLDTCDLDAECVFGCTEGVCDLAPEQEQVDTCVRNLECEFNCAEHLDDLEGTFGQCYSQCFQADRRLMYEEDLSLSKSNKKTEKLPVSYDGDVQFPPWSPCDQSCPWSDGPEEIARWKGCQMIAKAAHDPSGYAFCGCMGKLRRLSVDNLDPNVPLEYTIKLSIFESKLAAKWDKQDPRTLTSSPVIQALPEQGSKSISVFTIGFSCLVLVSIAMYVMKKQKAKLEQTYNDEPYIRLPLLK